VPGSLVGVLSSRPEETPVHYAARTPVVMDLAEIDPGRPGLIGGKADGPARMIRAGERVPDGFCITTVAHDAAAASGELGDDLRQEILHAYERLGGGAVAVRSSATAEDLRPDATRLITTGQLITVDGAAGTVRVTPEGS
jgi:pyruvate,water dikinase